MERLHDAWGPFVGKISGVVVNAGSCQNKERKLNCLQYRYRLFTIYSIACFFFCHFTRAAEQ